MRNTFGKNKLMCRQNARGDWLGLGLAKLGSSKFYPNFCLALNCFVIVSKQNYKIQATSSTRGNQPQVKKKTIKRNRPPYLLNTHINLLKIITTII